MWKQKLIGRRSMGGPRLKAVVVLKPCDRYRIYMYQCVLEHALQIAYVCALNGISFVPPIQRYNTGNAKNVSFCNKKNRVISIKLRFFRNGICLLSSAPYLATLEINKRCQQIFHIDQETQTDSKMFYKRSVACKKLNNENLKKRERANVEAER